MFRSRVRRVERAMLTGNLLTALDGLGVTLWTHRFPGILQSNPNEELPEWRVQVVDMEGVGDPGVLAVCSHLSEPSSPQPTSDDLYYFRPDGRIQWIYSLRPDLLDLTGQHFEPVWRFSHVIPVPSGKRQMLWAGVHHGWRWPGCVLRFDGAGPPVIQFANSGFVERLCRIPTPEGELIAVGGENNAFGRASVAVLAVNDPPSSSPGGGEKRCYFSNSPSGQPRDYILFPSTEMLTALDTPYGQVTQIYATNTSGFIVTIVSARTTSELFMYEFSARTEPDSVMPSGSCSLFHRRLEKEGKLNHTWDVCPDLANPLTIRHWRRVIGWRDEKVPWRAANNER